LAHEIVGGASDFDKIIRPSAVAFRNREPGVAVREALVFCPGERLESTDQSTEIAQLAQLRLSEADPSAAFRPSGQLGQALGQNPLTSAASSQATTAYQTAISEYQTAAGQTISTYQQIVKLQPKNQEALFALAQAADNLQQSTVAIGAYKKLLELDLDATTKAQIRARIKTLQAGAQG